MLESKEAAAASRMGSMKCELCGKRPATDIGSRTYLCGEHAPEYRVYHCVQCGQRVLVIRERVSDDTCELCKADQRIAELPTSLLERIDEMLEGGARLQVMKLLMDECQPRPSLVAAQDMMARRLDVLGQPPRPPVPEPTVDELFEKVGLVSPQPVAIEAIWDGDTTGWFVVLVAIVPGESRDHRSYDEKELATFSSSVGDNRLFRGEVPPWPEAIRASEVGGELANRLGLPFFFSSPDRPDDTARRWWDRV